MLVIVEWKWRKVQNIITHTNINVGSLNPTFGNKPNLFPSALLVFDHHFENVRMSLPRQSAAVRTRAEGDEILPPGGRLLVRFQWLVIDFSSDSCNGSKPVRFGGVRRRREGGDYTLQKVCHNIFCLRSIKSGVLAETRHWCLITSLTEVCLEISKHRRSSSSSFSSSPSSHSLLHRKQFPAWLIDSSATDNLTATSLDRTLCFFPQIADLPPGKLDGQWWREPTNAGLCVCVCVCVHTPVHAGDFAALYITVTVLRGGTLQWEEDRTESLRLLTGDSLQTGHKTNR